MTPEKKVLVRVRDMRQWFPIKKWFFEKPAHVKAVDGVSFDVYEGETLGVAGESGCGKSTLIRSILRLIEPTDGAVEYAGRDITHLQSRQMRDLRKHMQIVFQDPYSSLDARWTVGKIIEEPMIINKVYPTKEERMAKVRQLMVQVGLPESYVDRYPHEFSGGQRQRICIARALALNPEFVVCDEPVSALDVSIQAQIINLLKELQGEYNLTYLFISHDLSVVEHISDTVGVMYLGNLVEYGETDDIFKNPLHPYTKALFSAIPIPDPKAVRNRIVLEGSIPSPANPPQGCKFHTRCPYATERCKCEVPVQKEVEPGHYVVCHLYDE